MSKDQYKLSPDDTEIIDYIYKRNSQLFTELDKGMKFKQAAEIFCLSANTIKTMYRKHRHQYKQIYIDW